MKLLRILLSTLGLFIVVCVFAVSCLLIFVNPNKLKPVIAQEVMKRTRYQMVIDGDLSWSFYPRLGVKVDHMTLRDPDQTTPFVDLHDVKVAAGWRQLLHGNEKLEGDVYISNVKLMNINAQDAHVGLHWQNKVLTLQSITASLYEGKLEGSAQGRELSAVPAWNWNMQFNKIQLKSLLQDVNGADSKLNVSGLGQVKLYGSTKGKSRNEIFNNLNGASEFSLNNGIVEGIDLNYLVQSADAFINRQPVAALTNTNQTHFNGLTGSVIIKNGVANTNNLFLVSSAFTTKGEGYIDLANQTLEYQLQVMPLHPTKIEWAIPVLVKGDLHHPDVRLDTLTLETMITRDQLEKVGKKVEKELKKLPEQADKLFQKLLGK